MNTFEETKANLKVCDIDSLLEEIQVLEPYAWNNQASKALLEWWAVSNN